MFVIYLNLTKTLENSQKKKNQRTQRVSNVKKRTTILIKQNAGLTSHHG